MPPKPATSDLEWPAWLAAELEANALSGVVGSELVSESDRVRVWSLKLQPGERIGFHRHVLDYFWTVLNDGRGVSHYSDGRTVEVAYRAGDTKHLAFAAGEFILHDLQNFGDSELGFVTVEFLDSANAPLPVPAHKRR